MLPSDGDSQEVVIVAGTVQNGPRPNILNTDGQPHPVENILTILTLVTGLVSFVLGLIVRNVSRHRSAVHHHRDRHRAGLVLVGLYVQMVSSTRNQRVLIVTGIIAGFVGLAIGLSKGGFVG